MKRLFLALGLLMVWTATAVAQQNCVDLQEIDGSPRAPCVRKILVTNGTLTCATTNSCTLTTGGGGGGGSPGGLAGQVQWNDTGAFNGTSGLTATATTVTIVSGVTATFSRAGLLYTGTVTTDNASVQTQIIQGDRATVTANDEAYVTYRLSNAAGTQTEVARQTWAIPTATAASENGRIDWSVMTGGALAKELQLSGADLAPSTNDGLALGTAANQFSDLFLANGAVIDFANGNAVLTHSSGILTVSTGDLRVTSAGTNAASVATLSASQTLTNKTLATGTAFAGFSDIATIAAPANPSAGNIRLYADSGTGDLTCLTSAGGNCLPSSGGGLTIGDAITSGTASRVLYEGAGNVLAQAVGFTFDGTSVLTLGEAGTSVGTVAFKNATSGTVNLLPVTGALGTVTLSLPARTATVATTDGALTNGNCAEFDAGGNLVDSGGACGGSGSPGGADTQFQYNNAGNFGGVSTFTTDGTLLAIAATVTTGTGATSGLNATANALTTGTAFNFTSTSVTSGSIVHIASTSTAGATGVEGLNIAMSGANGTAAQTVTGQTISVTNTNGTSGTNVGLALTASGATTANYAIEISAGQLKTTTGAVGTPAIRVNDAGLGITRVNANQLSFVASSASQFAILSNALTLTSGVYLSWASTTPEASSAVVGFTRPATDTIRVSAGSAGAAAGNFVIGTSTVGSIGTSGVGVLAIANGTAPSSSPADTAQLYTADINATAGSAGFHIRNEINTAALIMPGVRYKTDTGDPSDVFEGMMVINTTDNTFKVYADGAWRTIATW